jgi:hypothetical protein
LKTYTPGIVPQDTKQLPDFLRRELTALVQAAHRAEPYLVIEAMKTAPSKAMLGVFAGSGAPTFSAAKGSMYLRTDGSSTSTRAYIATDSAGTWTAVTTAA